jgi:hypothetical protein
LLLIADLFAPIGEIRLDANDCYETGFDGLGVVGPEYEDDPASLSMTG